MSKILLTIHDEAGNLKLVQLDGKAATSVIKMIRDYGIDVHSEMNIPDLGLYVHKVWFV